MGQITFTYGIIIDLVDCNCRDSMDMQYMSVQKQKSLSEFQQGVFLVMKTLKGGWYVVVKAYTLMKGY